MFNQEIYYTQMLSRSKKETLIEQKKKGQGGIKSYYKITFTICSSIKTEKKPERKERKEQIEQKEQQEQKEQKERKQKSDV